MEVLLPATFVGTKEALVLPAWVGTNDTFPATEGARVVLLLLPVAVGASVPFPAGTSEGGVDNTTTGTRLAVAITEGVGVDGTVLLLALGATVPLLLLLGVRVLFPPTMVGTRVVALGGADGAAVALTLPGVGTKSPATGASVPTTMNMGILVGTLALVGTLLDAEDGTPNVVGALVVFVVGAPMGAVGLVGIRTGMETVVGTDGVRTRVGTVPLDRDGAVGIPIIGSGVGDSEGSAMALFVGGAASCRSKRRCSTSASVKDQRKRRRRCFECCFSGRRRKTTADDNRISATFTEHNKRRRLLRGEFR